MSNFTRQILILVGVLAAAYAGYYTHARWQESQAANQAAIQAVDNAATANPNDSSPANEAPTAGDLMGFSKPSSNPPKQLPEFSLADLEGQQQNISQWLNNNKPLLINFWATWCPPCRDELPLLIELQAQQPDLQVLGIAMNEANEVKQFAADTKLNFNFPNLVGQLELADILTAVGNSTGALPYTLAVSANGDVVYHHLGELKAADIAQIKTALELP